MSQPSSRFGARLARLLTLPMLFALCSALFCGNAERLHARLLWLGESLFTGYFQLQNDPLPPPNCDQLFKDEINKQSNKEEEDLEDLFGEENNSEKASVSTTETDDELEGLFGEEEEDQSSAQADLEEARRRAKAKCEAEVLAFADINSRITPSVKIFRAIEGGVSTFIAWVVEHFKHFLALIFILGALIASVLDEHIALRPAQSVAASRIRALTQMGAFAFVTISTWYYRALLTLPEELSLNLIWLIGLSTLTIWHLYQVIVPPVVESRDEAPSSPLLSIPLFAIMGWISGAYFFSVGHPTGLAIELTKLTEHAILYVNVALYVWVGMLLKQSILTTRIFDILRPLKLEPSILAAVVVVGAAAVIV